MHESYKNLVFEEMEKRGIGVLVFLFGGGNDSGGITETLSYSTLLPPGATYEYQNWGDEEVLVEDENGDGIELIKTDQPWGDNNAKRLLPNDMPPEEVHRKTYYDLAQGASLWHGFLDYDEPLSDKWTTAMALADFIENENVFGDTSGSVAANLRQGYKTHLLELIVEVPIDLEYGSFAGDYEVNGALVWDRANRVVRMIGTESFNEQRGLERSF